MLFCLIMMVGVFSVQCILYYIYFALFSTYTYYVLCIKQINFKLYIYTVYIYYLGFQKNGKIERRPAS